MATNYSSTRFIIDLNWIDALTLSSVITTSIAFVFAMNEFWYGSLAFLFIAMTADALDGALARMFDMQRNFGRYLDGFMDVLIYLVAPAILVYRAGFDGFYGAVLMLFIAAGCVRLAVFNETGSVAESGQARYLGMPVFWSIFIVALYFLLRYNNVPSIIANTGLAIALALFSWQMVQNKTYFKFSSIGQMLSLTIGGTILFAAMQLSQLGLTTFVDRVYLAWYLQIPVVFGGAVHMWMVSKNHLQGLAVPLNQRWFGENKTFRGFVVMPLATGTGWILLAFTSQNALIPWVEWFELGVLLGAVYVLAELPNSLIKRRLGIAPGARPQRYRGAFFLMDQLDSGVGLGLVYWWCGFFDRWGAVVFITSFPLTALVAKSVLFAMGWKKSYC